MKVTLTLTDNDGGVDVRWDFDPPATKDTQLTKASAIAAVLDNVLTLIPRAPRKEETR